MNRPPCDKRDNKGWLTFWANELLDAIERAKANPQPTGLWDHDMLQVIRCARIAHSRAMKVKPSLRGDR